MFRSFCLTLLTLSLLAFLLKAEEPRADPISHGLLARTIQVGNFERTYELYVPRSYDGQTALPLLLMLHGGGGTSQGARHETGWDKKAEAAGFIAVFPQATRPDPEKPARFGSNSPIWNDGSGRFHAGKRQVPDVAFISALIDKLIEDYPVDQRRVFVTGFSNGASMAFRVGAELSDKVAAIAPVAGALWLEKIKLKRPLPLLYITGAKDTLNPLAGGVPRLARGRRGIGGAAKPPVRKSIKTWAGLLSCPHEPSRATVKNGIRTAVYGPGKQHSEVRFLTLAQTGHVWPGGVS